MTHDGGRSDFRPCTTLATWPAGSFVENIAVDATGVVFVTLHTERLVVRVDPRTGETSPEVELPLPVAGLVAGPDGVLYASGGELGRAPGMIWRIAPDRSVETVAVIPDAVFLNGMTLHPDGRLLVAESQLGRVYAVDVGRRDVSVWLDDPALRPVADAPDVPGVNGIKLRGGAAILTVTGPERLVSTVLQPDGSAGPLATLAENLRGDDFAVGADGSLFIATHPACSLVRLAPDGTRSTLAEAQHGMVGSTAVAFGRRPDDRHCVYVTTTGGTMTRPPDALEPAKLVRVDVGMQGATDPRWG